MMMQQLQHKNGDTPHITYRTDLYTHTHIYIYTKYRHTNNLGLEKKIDDNISYKHEYPSTKIQGEEFDEDGAPHQKMVARLAIVVGGGEEQQQQAS